MSTVWTKRLYRLRRQISQCRTLIRWNRQPTGRTSGLASGIVYYPLDRSTTRWWSYQVVCGSVAAACACTGFVHNPHLYHLCVFQCVAQQNSDAWCRQVKIHVSLLGADERTTTVKQRQLNYLRTAKITCYRTTLTSFHDRHKDPVLSNRISYNQSSAYTLPLPFAIITSVLINGTVNRSIHRVWPFFYLKSIP